MNRLERAANLYCQQKGLDPYRSGPAFTTIGEAVRRDLEDLELKLWCLKQAENTKP